MPLKKNGKKGADKSSKKEGIGSGGKVDEELSEEGKEFYRAQIRDLEERLEKYQHKCDELEVREKDFSTSYNNVEREKKDIVLYLKRSLAQKEEELSDLSEKLQALQIAKDTEKESSEMQMSILRHELQESKDKLTSENMALAGKLACLEEFRAQKDELMTRLASLKEQLEQEKQDHQSAVHNLERKAILDNERLKKEMQQHVNDVAAEFRRVSDRKMPETTLRAIRENMWVTAQLRQLADKHKGLLEENDALKAREKQLKREMNIMEPLLNEMTRKNLGNQKVVQQLTQKCKQMFAEIDNCNRQKEAYQQMLDDHGALQKGHDALRQEHDLVVEELNRLLAETELLRNELQEEKMQRRRLEEVLQEAAAALTEALREVPKEEDSEAHALVRRGHMIQKLLAVLNSAVAIGKGPTLSDFIPSTDHTHKLTKRADIERQDLQAQMPKAVSRLTHFQTGDLGLVPRQTHMRGTVLSKTGLCPKAHSFICKGNSKDRKELSPPKP